MAKAQRTVKQTQAISTNGRGHMIEQHENYDDSLLPDSAELERLQAIDPNIVPWILARTEKEQDHRHQADNKKISLVNKGTNLTFTIDVITVLCAFIIIMASMGFSYYLISAGNIVTGTVFAGGTIILTAHSFLNYRKKPSDNEKAK